MKSGRGHAKTITPTTDMIKPNEIIHTICGRPTQPSKDAPAKEHQLIKLSADVHAASYSVVLQIENTAAKAPRKMSPATFVDFVGQQLRRAHHVVVAYEAGPTGFWLARKVRELGALCVVTRPIKLDLYQSGRKSDNLDVRALSERLDRFVAGNRHALAPVAIPSQAEELSRAQSRQRDYFKKQRQAFAAHGRGQMLLWDLRARGYWWRPARWQNLRAQFTAAQLALIEPLRQSLRHLDEQLAAQEAQLRRAGQQHARPKGAGAMTLEQIDREVGDWERFENRKQPGSFPGLTGGLDASGEHYAELSITKAGHRRLRHLLIELSWRMVYWQADSPLIQRWKHILLNPKAHTRARKKAIVAVARRLMVDLWRWRTGRRSAEELGWEMMPALK